MKSEIISFGKIKGFFRKFSGGEGLQEIKKKIIGFHKFKYTISFSNLIYTHTKSIIVLRENSPFQNIFEKGVIFLFDIIDNYLTCC